MKELFEQLKNYQKEYNNIIKEAKKIGVKLYYVKSELSAKRINKAIIDNKIVTFKNRTKEYNVLCAKPYYPISVQIKLDDSYNNCSIIIEYINSKQERISTTIESSRVIIREKLNLNDIKESDYEF